MLFGFSFCGSGATARLTAETYLSQDLTANQSLEASVLIELGGRKCIIEASRAPVDETQVDETLGESCIQAIRGTGNSTVTDAPCPGVPVSLIEPPWRMMIFRASGNPSPIPLGFPD